MRGHRFPPEMDLPWWQVVHARARMHRRCDPGEQAVRLSLDADECAHTLIGIRCLARAHSPGPPTGAPTGPRAQASSGTLNGGSARRDNRRYQDKDRQDRSDRSGLEGLDYGGGGQRDQSPPGTRARGGTARERSPLSPPPQSGHGGMDRSRSGTEYSESESGRRASGNYDDLSGSASRGEAQRAPPPPLRRIRGAAAASESSSGRRGEDHGDGWATRSRYSGEYERPEKRRHEDDADERRRKMTRPQRGSGGGGREGASDGYGDDW